jgi:hypothetical protein
VQITDNLTPPNHPNVVIPSTFGPRWSRCNLPWSIGLPAIRSNKHTTLAHFSQNTLTMSLAKIQTWFKQLLVNSLGEFWNRLTQKPKK